MKYLTLFFGLILASTTFASNLEVDIQKWAEQDLLDVTSGTTDHDSVLKLENSVKEKNPGSALHFFKNARLAKREYAEWKAEHPKENANFLKSARALQNKFKKDTSLIASLQFIQAISNPDLQAKAYEDFIQDQFQEVGLAPSLISTARAATSTSSRSSRPTSLSCTNRQNWDPQMRNLGFDAIIYGKSKYNCPGNPYSVVEQRFGVGLGFLWLEGVAFVCAAPIKGVAFGPVANASAFLAGLKFGILVGKSGVCMVLGGSSLAIDAFAGFSLVNFDSDEELIQRPKGCRASY